LLDDLLFLGSISTASCVHNGSSINFVLRFGYGLNNFGPKL
jgi:hypothetical protein